MVRFGASHLSLCRIDVKGCAGYVAVQRRNKLIVKEHNGQDENISVWSPLSVAGFFFCLDFFFLSSLLLRFSKYRRANTDNWLYVSTMNAHIELQQTE